ncbi:MAG: hypothetical protein J7L86_03595, partial [Candidatus Marinimicrobia bacterium]|nr:hypothetical protein [Candidatus Neomarinimicrobiota bacterium]
KIRMCAVNSEGLSDRFLDYAASIIIIAKIRDRIICDKSGVLKIHQDSTQVYLGDMENIYSTSEPIHRFILILKTTKVVIRDGNIGSFRFTIMNCGVVSILS